MRLQKLPKWQELPDLDLYLDQILLYVNQWGPSERSDQKGLTASMVNNYVKHGHVEKPIKKKYQKEQLARLIAITHLKDVFSIQEVSYILTQLKEDYSSEQLYDYFVDALANKHYEETPDLIKSACQTIRLYRRTKQLSLDLKGDKTNGSNP